MVIQRNELDFSIAVIMLKSPLCSSAVEKLLSVCGSSCLPGGGSNTELALHCLHYCQGDTMVTLNVFTSVLLVTTLTRHRSPVQATLEMLLFSRPSPAGDYHYSGKPDLIFVI